MRKCIVTNIIIFVVGVIATLLFLGMNTIWASQYEKEATFQSPNWDSMKVITKVWEGSWTIRDDSVWLESGETVTLILDSDSTFMIEYLWLSAGDSTRTNEFLPLFLDTSDISPLALQAEVVNLDGWNPATDSVNVDGTAFATIEWATNLLQFLGWGEVGGDAVWGQDKKNNNADTLWVGTSDGAGSVDTIGYQVNFHVGGTAGDPPDSVKSYLWP